MLDKVKYVDDFVLSGGVLLLNQNEPPTDLGAVPEMDPAVPLFSGTGYWAQKTTMPSKRSDHEVRAPEYVLRVNLHRPRLPCVIVNFERSRTS